jgi:hypothetical protein
LSRSSPPTLAPRGAGHNPPRDELRPPRREEIERAETRWVKRGGPTKADLKIVDVGQGPLVVKDFRAKAAWVRWIGRLQIARECRAYRWLEGLAGIPRFAGRVDAHALAIEWIRGELLAFLPERRHEGAVTHGKLREVVEGMHRRGLVHLDLRGKDNVVLTPDGRVVVLDLAAAVRLRPGGWPHRLLFRWLATTDEAALLKWKRILGSEPYTADEQAFLRRYRFWRALWIFNRKRPLGE